MDGRSQQIPPCPRYVGGELHNKLIEISEAFRSEDLEELKFLCYDILPASTLQDADSALKIFELLKTRNMLTDTNIEILLECLWWMHRRDLIRKLVSNLSELEAFILGLNHILPFRKLVLKLSDAIEHEDLQTLKFYVKSISKKKKVWDAKNTMELFVSLEQAGHIKHEDPEPLIEMMTRIGRNDLIGLINNHFGRDFQPVNRVPMRQAEDLPQQLGATNEPTMVGPAPGNFYKEDIPRQLQQLSMNPVPALNPGTDNTGYQIPPPNQKPMHRPVMGKLGQSQEGGDIQTEEDLMSMENSSIMFLDPFKGRETQSVKSEPMLKVDDFLQGQGITNEQTLVGPVPGNLNEEILHRQLQQLPMNPATAIIPGAESSGNLIQPTNQYVMYQPRIDNITIIMPGQGESQKGGDNQTDDNWMSMGIPSCVIQEMRMPKLPINRTVSQEETLESIFKYGCPESIVPLIKKGHYIWFDKQTRLAKMVAYRLTKDDIEGPGDRDTSVFHPDPSISSDLQASQSAFKGSTTRGHMKPAGDAKSSQVTRTTIKVWMNLNFRQIQLLTELLLKVLRAMSPLFLVAVDVILCKVGDNEEMHNILDVFKFCPDWATDNRDAMDDTFQFTNIYPEYKNNKMWLAIEVYVREKVLKSFKEAHIYIMLAFRPNKSGIVAYPVVGKSKCAVPTHMFKFVIATPESDNETLVTGSFVVPNQDDYCDKELKKGNEAFKYVFDNEVKTDIITIARDTGTQFDEMLSKNIHKYNEDLLQQCSFITAEEYKQYEEKHIKERMARKQKDKGVQKSAEKQNKNKNKC